MPGLLKHDLVCPECGRSVSLVVHAWSGAEDTATFEYHHVGDSASGPCCVSVMTFAEGLARCQQEEAPA